MFKYAEKSPRITEDGTICWYEGDTFELTLNFNFIDAESGESIEPQPTDEILICFENFQSNEKVYEAQFKGTNSITLSVDEEVTKLFKVGRYRYSAKRKSQFITTIIHNNLVVVE